MMGITNNYSKMAYIPIASIGILISRVGDKAQRAGQQSKAMLGCMLLEDSSTDYEDDTNSKTAGRCG